MEPQLDPEEILAGLCRRHGLDPRDGRDLLPLVRHALAARESVRRQALRLVDQTLARQAVQGGKPVAGDQRLLTLVARMLHDWNSGAA
jgi:hypothetical protein